MMCHYVQKVHGIEILSMNAEFAIDDDNKIWFIFAKDIMISTRKKKDLMNQSEYAK
jgi:hypothetical protein